MPKLLKREKAPEEPVEAEAAHTAPAVEAEAAEPAATAGEAMPPEAHEPAPPVGATPGPGRGSRVGGLLGRMYGEPGEMSRADRERQAAMEFEQAVAPVMEMLVGSVPEASSPEEAARAWESRAGEVRPDPGAGAYVPGDAYEREARVYYRLLRRDYQKDPRPSLANKRGLTHHLHGRYNLFPGTKGW